MGALSLQQYNSLQTMEVASQISTPHGRWLSFQHLKQLWVCSLHSTERANRPLHEFMQGSRREIRDLYLGSNLDVVHHYRRGLEEPSARVASRTAIVLAGVKKTAERKGRTSIAPSLLELESLQLSGLNIGTLVESVELPLFIIENLSCLVLDQCLGLDEVLIALEQRHGCETETGPDYPLKLKRFSIRQDFCKLHTVMQLEAFLVAFRGLEHLSVLLEGMTPLDLGPILKIHGSTLLSLVWDERGAKRIEACVPVHAFTTPVGRLTTIAEECPHLKALGIALDWKDLTNSNLHHPEVM